MKKLFLTFLLSLGLTSISSAGYLDDWTDDQICGWMDNASPPEYIVDEAIKRNLDCIPESEKKKAQEDTGLQIMIFDADFSESDLDELSSTDIQKTDFDFDIYKIANNHRNLLCQFKIKEVLYDNSVEGEIKHWNVAEGYLVIDSGKVNIDVDKGSRWKRGGLSSDPSYLRDEVNLRLTEDGYLVGKMAYFEWVGEGEVPKKPFYVELIKHKKSKPLNHKNPKIENAALWIEVNDWSDGVLYLSNCIFYEENYKDGKLDGKKTAWHGNGQKMYEQNYKNGQKEGKSSTWYQNGQIKSENNYRDGKNEGKSSTWYQNGQIKSESNYRDGKKEGKSTTRHQNGQIKSENNYRDGKNEGKSTTWYQNGQIKSEDNYKDGKKENKSTTWHQNGQIKSEVIYKNTESKMASWYKNGQKKAENNYKDGNREGKSTTWYENNDQIKSEVNYKNNKREGKETAWYRSGEKKSEVNYKDGDKEGKSTTWYENSQIKSEVNYKDNKRVGKRTAWYENGQKNYEDNFKDGKLDGKKTTWHENGQIKSESNYKDGKLIVTE